jgi:DNA replication protein
MRPFTGFPEKMEVTPVPTVFLTSIMPHINDVAELKIILIMFKLLSQRPGLPRFVVLSELVKDTTLIEGIGSGDLGIVEKTVEHALNIAVEHGVLLHLKVNKDNKAEDIYLLNTEAEKKTANRIISGEINVKGLTLRKGDTIQPVSLPNIFSLYEQNIGILTPIIAENLQDAEQRYPQDWIESAFKEAVSLNKRNWKYIARILERWATEGKDDGTLGRDTKKTKDPDRYVKGKYGHMVQR